MHTYDSFMTDLSQSAINSKGTLLVHSSMKAIGEVDGGADAVLDALIQYMKDGLLLFPTHTWHEDNCVDGIYDYKSEKSCVGYLTNQFRMKEGVIRSLHPSHSVAAIGSRASEYVKHDDTAASPCPRHGCMGSLYDEDAQILFLGTKLTTNTYIHSLEESLEIPNRINETSQIYKVVQRDGSIKEVEYNGHFSTYGDVSKNYDKIEDELFKRGIASRMTYGDAPCILVKVRPLTDYVIELLKVDPDLFGDKRPLPKL